MKKYLILFIIFIFSCGNIFSQEIIKYKGDTLVAIKPEDIKYINTVFVEHSYFKKELELYKKSSFVDSVLITTQDSIIRTKDIVISKKDIFYTDLTKNLEISLEREKRKHQVTKTLLGTGVVAIIILLCK